MCKAAIISKINISNNIHKKPNKVKEYHLKHILKQKNNYSHKTPTFGTMPNIFERINHSWENNVVIY